MNASISSPLVLGGVMFGMIALIFLVAFVAIWIGKRKRKKENVFNADDGVFPTAVSSRKHKKGNGTRITTIQEWEEENSIVATEDANPFALFAATATTTGELPPEVAVMVAGSEDTNVTESLFTAPELTLLRPKETAETENDHLAQVPPTAPAPNFPPAPSTPSPPIETGEQPMRAQQKNEGEETVDVEETVVEEKMSDKVDTASPVEPSRSSSSQETFEDHTYTPQRLSTPPNEPELPSHIPPIVKKNSTNT